MDVFAEKRKLLIAGIDDATKCPCIGSIFIAGVVADEKTIKKWASLGVTDSKKLTRAKREELTKVIEKTALAFSVQEITPAMIDDKSVNLNTMEMIVFLSIMDELQKRSSIDYAYVDNWEVNPILFWERLHTVLQHDLMRYVGKSLIAEHMLKTTLIPEHQADEKYVVVGAASILAKTYSDFQYDQYKITYGDFGSGSPGDPATRRYVWQHRENPTPIIRKSWSTYKVLSQLESIEQDPLYLKKNRMKNNDENNNEML